MPRVVNPTEEMSHMRRIEIGILTALAAAAIACGGAEEPAPLIETGGAIDVPPSDEPAPPPTASERLARGVDVALDAGGSAISVVVARDGRLEVARPIAAAGEMAVRVATGALVSSGLTIELADIELSRETFPPNGLHLTDIRGTIALDRLEASWDGEHAATFAGSAQIRVEWSLVTKNGTLAVRPIEISGVPVEGALAVGADERIAVVLNALARGVLLDVAGLAQVSDLSLELALSE
jgi:hypothetical protein